MIVIKYLLNDMYCISQSSSDSWEKAIEEAYAYNKTHCQTLEILSKANGLPDNYIIAVVFDLTALGTIKRRYKADIYHPANYMSILKDPNT